MRSLKACPQWLLAIMLCVCAVPGCAQDPAARADAKPFDAVLSIDAGAPGARISPAMWGIFFEDINFGADGGIYAELVKNRSFEFPEPLMGWHVIRRKGSLGSVEVCGDYTGDAAARRSAVAPNLSPAAAVRHFNFLRVVIRQPGEGFGIANEGFRGMGVRRDAAYLFSAKVRAMEGGPFTLTLALLSQDGRVIGEAKADGFTAEWKEHTVRLLCTQTEPKARLNVMVEGRGRIDLDMISLFPEDTWMRRPRGLRADIVQMLADLKPGFVRFPGGCIVEGFHLETRYQWKKTLGNPAERPVVINRWNNEFSHRPAPDYFQTFGLGFFEYFQLCEDIGAVPLPILSCGMACQFNSGELAPLDELDPYIQDALDLIEFAKGPVTSTWGATRAALGHPEPFKITMLGIGNEQWGPQYVERYERFAKVLKEKHPEIALISSAGPDPDGEKFDFLWPRLRALGADIVDEHYYRPPAWFLDNAHRYDGYDRKGPAVFAGEYAAQSVRTCSPDNRNNWECALAEAAFMTGLERNADVVRMASYAPLFGHEEAWQWRPNLIWFDNLQVYGTPSYYVQKLFSCNRGDVLLPVIARGAVVESPNARCYVSATKDASTGDCIVKVVNAAATPIAARVGVSGVAAIGPNATATVLAGANLSDENSLDNPAVVAPVEKPLATSGAAFDFTFAPWSFTVLRVPTK